jgi:hypothetical protein
MKSRNEKIFGSFREWQKEFFPKSYAEGMSTDQTRDLSQIVSNCLNDLVIGKRAKRKASTTSLNNK